MQPSSAAVQYGANSIGQYDGRGCAGATCTGVDNPLPVLTKQALPLRLSLVYNPDAMPNITGVAEVAVSITVNSHREYRYEAVLPELEQFVH